ncbi:MAG: 2TM domain-containing protein [Bacteroidales bacterium]|jgi:hypothetical protein|nr:2TM domain-containing protein [Bacteroidales bacterium]
MNNNDYSEEKLVKRASKRAGFKIHTGIFILVNLFFWVIWYFVFRGSDAGKPVLNAVLFLSIAWLIAIIGHYFIVYKWNKSLLDKELTELKKEIERKEKEVNKLTES